MEKLAAKLTSLGESSFPQKGEKGGTELRRYVPPELVEVGVVKELTLGVSGMGGDAGSMTMN